MECDDETDRRIQGLLWQQLCRKRMRRTKRQQQWNASNATTRSTTGDERTKPRKRKQPDQRVKRPETEEKTECSICLEKLKQRKRTSLACGHTFHARCIRKAETHNLVHCPLCRYLL